MPIDQAEFAAKAGVTPCTVSRALNNDPRVHSRTRQRIKMMARKLGYRPNPVARSLRKQSEQNVGVVIATSSSGTPAYMLLSEYALFLVHLTEQLESRDRGLLLATACEAITMDTASVQLPRIADHLHAQRLVVLSHMWPQLAEEIKLLSLPTVVIDGPSCGLPTVQRDEENAAEQLVDHLVEQGHRRIAFVNHGGGKVQTGYRDVLWPKGYLRAVTRQELVPLPGWDLYEDRETAIDRLLGLGKPPTAMIVYDDVEAMFTIKHVTEHGLAVPKDISIAAMIDCGMGEYHPLKITRMARPLVEMAQTVVQLLMDEKSDNYDDSPGVVRLAGELIFGETVSPGPYVKE